MISRRFLLDQMLDLDVAQILRRAIDDDSLVLNPAFELIPAHN